MAGVSGKGKLMQAGVSKVVAKAHGSSAGTKPQDGQFAGGVPGAIMPTKKVANPNGNTPLGANGTNKHANIAKGPGLAGKSKK